MSQEVDLLDTLLEASKELEKLDKKEHSLTQTDIFQTESNNTPSKEIISINKSLKTNNSSIHTGDTDSSDDEGNRNYENKKYSECGTEIKRLLDSSPTISSSHYGQPKQRISTWKSNPSRPKPSSFNLPPKLIEKPQDVFIDPIFGMRIVTPLINSSVLTDRMAGREAVTFSKIALHIQIGTKDKDWVICGVIASKSATRTSQKGSQYSIWTLTDLKDDIKTVSLFLFSGAYRDLWKTAVGTVVGVLNPNVLDRKDGSKDEACLSVDNAQKIMIFGHSKDFGTCKSMKKSGEKCTAIVNLNKCEFCIYHIKQEYQKCSKRSELQANFVGNGLTALRNKVLGKNEVFYAGKSYTAIPAKRSRKLEQKDERLLQSLTGKGGPSVKKPLVKSKNSTARKQNATCLEVFQSQRLRDLELLKKLDGSSSAETEERANFTGTQSTEVTLEESKNNALSVIHKLKQKNRVAKESIKKHPTSQYNLKSDLILNLESKKKFDGKISEDVTLEDSKSTALSVISKLRAKKKVEKQKLEEYTSEEQQHNESIFDDEEFDLEYDDCFNNSTSAEKITSPKLNDCKEKTPSQPNGVPKASACVQITGSNLNIVKNKASSNVKETVLTPDKALKSQPVAISSVSKLNIITNSPKLALTMVKNNTVHNSNGVVQFPRLSGSSNSFVDLSKPVVKRHSEKVKENAIKMIQKKGPIKKLDPNNTKGTTTGKKRAIEELMVLDNPAAKKSKLQESEFISDRFKKMMAATSKHTDLLEIHDHQEKEKYFNKLEAKEKMEEKMTSTYKVACKAVRCLQCKYTSFSAAERCKTERHPLKVYDAMKRFFKCGNCQNRTASLDVVPTFACKNCGSGKWERTGMMKEKVAVVQHNLSIRGGEQKFVNAVATDTNINLLVPEDGA